MALHAVGDVEDALAVTREFLTPFDARRWLKLALVVFFVSGGTGFPTTGFDAGPSTGLSPGPEPTPDVPGDALLVVAGLVALLAFLVLAFLLVGSVMEFVFVESLRSGEVAVRRYWGRRWRQGLRLFGFRLLVGLAVAALAAGLLALVFAPLLVGLAGPLVLIGLVVVLPLLVVVALVVGLVNGFTTMFVVPVMILEDCGVLAGWRRLKPSLVEAWKQYLAYAVVAFLLQFGLGIAVTVVLGLVAVVLLVPFGGLGLLVAATLSLSSAAGLVIVGLLALVFLCLLFLTTALVQVPVQTYLRYYALLVLGDVEESLDLVPDRRAAVRE